MISYKNLGSGFCALARRKNGSIAALRDHFCNAAKVQKTQPKLTSYCFAVPLKQMTGFLKR
jgi:hypothetical protein